MPSKVRIISGPRDKSFDHFIKDILDNGRWEVEHTYFGIANQERADLVRRKIRTAGYHMEPRVSVKSFWYECEGCEQGGPNCRYHISYTVFDYEKARAYKERMAQAAGMRDSNA